MFNPEFETSGLLVTLRSCSLSVVGEVTHQAMDTSIQFTRLMYNRS
jgi:hypothetical protein